MIDELFADTVLICYHEKLLSNNRIHNLLHKDFVTNQIYYVKNYCKPIYDNRLQVAQDARRRERSRTFRTSRAREQYG